MARTRAETGVKIIGHGIGGNHTDAAFVQMIIQRVADGGNGKIAAQVNMGHLPAGVDPAIGAPGRDDGGGLGAKTPYRVLQNILDAGGVML